MASLGRITLFSEDRRFNELNVFTDTTNSFRRGEGKEVDSVWCSALGVLPMVILLGGEGRRKTQKKAGMADCQNLNLGRRNRGKRRTKRNESGGRTQESSVSKRINILTQRSDLILSKKVHLGGKRALQTPTRIEGWLSSQA